MRSKPCRVRPKKDAAATANATSIGNGSLAINMLVPYEHIVVQILINQSPVVSQKSIVAGFPINNHTTNFLKTNFMLYPLHINYPLHL